MIIKALTLDQPWATLVAIGLKHWETRGFGTDYRGPFAIHSGKAIKEHAVRFAKENDMCRIALEQIGIVNGHIEDLPRGKVLAVGLLKRIYGNREMSFNRLSKFDKEFGLWGPGRKGWLIDPIMELAEPIPARGKQGIWNWVVPDHLEIPVGLLKVGGNRPLEAMSKSKDFVEFQKKIKCIHIGRGVGRDNAGSIEILKD